MMLIRSQDRKLLTPLNRSINVFGRNVVYCDEAENSDGYLLGTYDSESRCLEILDEIQRMFADYKVIYQAVAPSFGGPSFLFDQPKVYQMPEK